MAYRQSFSHPLGETSTLKLLFFPFELMILLPPPSSANPTCIHHHNRLHLNFLTDILLLETQDVNQFFLSCLVGDHLCLTQPRSSQDLSGCTIPWYAVQTHFPSSLFGVFSCLSRAFLNLFIFFKKKM